MKIKLAIGTITALFAAAAAWAETYTTSETLNSDVECTTLTLGAECDLDLNGHNLTFNGAAGDFAPTSGAKITNNGADAVVTIEATSGALNTQFQNVQFSGNLKLVVKGATSSNAGFQGVHNSHTLGTVLDGYGTSVNNTQPRFTTGDAFGSGPLTLNNDTYIHLTGSAITPSWSSINVTEGKGTLVNDQVMTLNEQNNKIVVTEGAIFSFGGNKDIKIYEWDTTGIAGTLEVAITGTNFLFIDKSGFPNGTLSIATEVRYRINEETGGAEIPIARLEGKGVLKHVKETLDDTAVTLVVSAGDFSGSIVRDTNGGDWNLRKTGDGELVLSGDNTYMGSTSIDGGKLTLKGEAAKLSGTSSISFAGGTLAYADGATQDLAGKIKSGTHTAPIHIDVESGTVTYNTNGNNLEEAAKEYGFIKDGVGTLYLNWRHNLVVPTIVNGGEFKMQFWKDIVKSDSITDENNRIYIADGAALTLDNGDVAGVPNLNTPVYGSGTLRVGAGKGETFRFNNGTDFTNFSGTLDFISSAFTKASGLMDGCDGLANTTLVSSYDSESSAKVFDIEMNGTKTIGALQVLGNSTYINVKNGLTLNVGEKADSETILNGYFTGSSSLKINKNGQTPITIGSGFTMPEGASLNINAASKLTVNTDLTAELPYTLTIASSIPVISGTGTVSQATFASAETYSVKATDGGITVDGTVSLESVTLVLDLEGVDASDKEKTYSLLTATTMTGPIPSAWSEKLEGLNAGDAHGKWKLVKVANGDGTVTLKCVYSKNAFVIILR